MFFWVISGSDAGEPPRRTCLHRGLSVCYQRNSKCCRRILIKSSGNVYNTWLHFRGDPVHCSGGLGAFLVLTLVSWPLALRQGGLQSFRCCFGFFWTSWISLWWTLSVILVGRSLLGKVLLCSRFSRFQSWFSLTFSGEPEPQIWFWNPLQTAGCQRLCLSAVMFGRLRVKAFSLQQGGSAWKLFFLFNK